MIAMAFNEWFGMGLILLGMPFFLAGTVGLLRFPDVYTRLHALTKADNLGLGLVSTGLALKAGSFAAAGKLLMIWLLVLVSCATACHLVARAALHLKEKPWVRT
jgi:multicomponent Na+:H+ antiporter subunit G